MRLTALLITLLVSNNLLSKTEPQPEYFEIFAEAFPTEEDEIRSSLWNMYEDHDTDWRNVYHTYKTEKWMDNFSKYTNEILDILEDKGSDRNWMERIFVQILMENHGQVVLLPYAIYHLKTNTESYWIVHCAWEYPANDPNPKYKLMFDEFLGNQGNNDSTVLKLMHIRMWAFRDSDLQLVGFTTCY